MLKKYADKIMFWFFVAFLFVGGCTFNFYNTMNETLRTISLITSIILFLIVIVFMLVKKNKGE